MNIKENPKTKYISFRVPPDTKVAFKKVADKVGVKMSDVLVEFVEAKIKEEGIVKIKIDKHEADVVEQEEFIEEEYVVEEYTENISFVKES